MTRNVKTNYGDGDPKTVTVKECVLRHYINVVAQDFVFWDLDYS